jgi:hypothetical protein
MGTGDGGRVGGRGATGDVDPSVSQEQLSDYTHVLDPWGNGLGLDVGRTCAYGRRGITASRAYKYCRRIWGTPGEGGVRGGREEERE